jgi:hypothetical protein
LTREIAKIDEFFYRSNEDEGRFLCAGMLERQRDDMVRAAVLQVYAAIEHNFYEIEAAQQDWTVGKLRRQFDAGRYDAAIGKMLTK